MRFHPLVPKPKAATKPQPKARRKAASTFETVFGPQAAGTLTPLNVPTPKLTPKPKQEPTSIELGADHDELEREADIVADFLMQVSSVEPQLRPQPKFGLSPTRALTAERSSLFGNTGHPLPACLRGELEPLFGSSLAHVRIHADAESNHLSRELGARAFTLGSHVGFAHGAFQPGSFFGRHLLAHELTHVMQQDAGTIRRRSWDSTSAALRVGDPSSPLERQAEAISARVMNTPEPSPPRRCSEPEQALAEDALEGELIQDDIIGEAITAAGPPADPPPPTRSSTRASGTEEHTLRTLGIAGTGATACEAVGPRGQLSMSYTNRLLAARRAGGRPLDVAARSFIEPRLGHDLSDLRVHTDATAHELASSIHAKAFTVNRHIFFTHGTYQPCSRSGLKLITHEVVHGLQRSAAMIQRLPLGFDKMPLQLLAPLLASIDAESLTALSRNRVVDFGDWLDENYDSLTDKGKNEALRIIDHEIPRALDLIDYGEAGVPVEITYEDDTFEDPGPELSADAPTKKRAKRKPKPKPDPTPEAKAAPNLYTSAVDWLQEGVDGLEQSAEDRRTDMELRAEQVFDDIMASQTPDEIFSDGVGLSELRRTSEYLRDEYTVARNPDAQVFISQQVEEFIDFALPPFAARLQEIEAAASPEAERERQDQIWDEAQDIAEANTSYDAAAFEGYEFMDLVDLRTELILTLGRKDPKIKAIDRALARKLDAERRTLASRDNMVPTRTVLLAKKRTRNYLRARGRTEVPPPSPHVLILAVNFGSLEPKELAKLSDYLRADQPKLTMWSSSLTSEVIDDLIRITDKTRDLSLEYEQRLQDSEALSTWKGLAISDLGLEVGRRKYLAAARAHLALAGGVALEENAPELAADLRAVLTGVDDLYDNFNFMLAHNPRMHQLWVLPDPLTPGTLWQWADWTKSMLSFEMGDSEPGHDTVQQVLAGCDGIMASEYLELARYHRDVQQSADEGSDRIDRAVTAVHAALWAKDWTRAHGRTLKSKLYTDIEQAYTISGAKTFQLEVARRLLVKVDFLQSEWEYDQLFNYLLQTEPELYKRLMLHGAVVEILQDDKGYNKLLHHAYDANIVDTALIYGSAAMDTEWSETDLSDLHMIIPGIRDGLKTFAWDLLESIADAAKAVGKYFTDSAFAQQANEMAGHLWDMFAHDSQHFIAIIKASLGSMLLEFMEEFRSKSGYAFGKFLGEVVIPETFGLIFMMFGAFVMVGGKIAVAGAKQIARVVKMAGSLVNKARAHPQARRASDMIGRLVRAALASKKLGGLRKVFTATVKAAKAFKTRARGTSQRITHQIARARKFHADHLAISSQRKLDAEIAWLESLDTRRLELLIKATKIGGRLDGAEVTPKMSDEIADLNRELDLIDEALGNNDKRRRYQDDRQEGDLDRDDGQGELNHAEQDGDSPDVDIADKDGDRDGDGEWDGAVEFFDEDAAGVGGGSSGPDLADELELSDMDARSRGPNQGGQVIGKPQPELDPRSGKISEEDAEQIWRIRQLQAKAADRLEKHARRRLESQAASRMDDPNYATNESGYGGYDRLSSFHYGLDTISDQDRRTADSFVTSIRSSLSGDLTTQWSGMTSPQKTDLIEETVRTYLRELGLPEEDVKKLNISLDNGNVTGVAGRYSPAENTLYINTTSPVVFKGDPGDPLAPGEILKTALHETRHVYQRWAVKKTYRESDDVIEQEGIAALWRSEMADPLHGGNINTGKDLFTYYNRATERNAESVARYIMDEIERSFATAPSQQ